jgi:hypothetical protein
MSAIVGGEDQNVCWWSFAISFPVRLVISVQLSDRARNPKEKILAEFQDLREQLSKEILTKQICLNTQSMAIEM